MFFNHTDIPELNYLKNEFALSFKLSRCSCSLSQFTQLVKKLIIILSQDNFSKLIAKKSKIQVINIKNQSELKIFLKKICLMMKWLFVWALEAYQIG